MIENTPLTAKGDFFIMKRSDILRRAEKSVRKLAPANGSESAVCKTGWSAPLSRVRIFSGPNWTLELVQLPTEGFGIYGQFTEHCVTVDPVRSHAWQG